VACHCVAALLLLLPSIYRYSLLIPYKFSVYAPPPGSLAAGTRRWSTTNPMKSTSKEPRRTTVLTSRPPRQRTLISP
jgi:hypothetical protein